MVEGGGLEPIFLWDGGDALIGHWIGHLSRSLFFRVPKVAPCKTLNTFSPNCASNVPGLLNLDLFSRAIHMCITKLTYATSKAALWTHWIRSKS